jgi:cytidyltransferase-like protein
MQQKKRVFVTGCFDMLHSGHVAFLQEAAEYGEVHVGLGSDSTIGALKGRYPINNQDERKYMLEALACVKKVIINRGSGIMDFVDEMKLINPDVFIVNEDGNTPAKEELCKRLGIKYTVLKRIPHGKLPARSTTALRKERNMPFRIDLAGGWLDQPFVGKFCGGPVLTVPIEPTIEFNDRSGMASSTRKKAIELWGTDVPSGNKEQLAKMLFSYENPPGTKVIAGSQDALGIVLPGLNRLDYDGGYWPQRITSVNDEDILAWLEEHLYLITLDPRTTSFDVLKDTKITEVSARALADAANEVWRAILRKDIDAFGTHFREAFEAQIAMFPNMVDRSILKAIEKYKGQAVGWKLSGAGGGGYIVYVSERTITGAFRVKIRRGALS